MNEGSELARKEGLIHARYEWVMCLDSDDTLTHKDIIVNIVKKQSQIM